jgi:hypothetical protein
MLTGAEARSPFDNYPITPTLENTNASCRRFSNEAIRRSNYFWNRYAPNPEMPKKADL